MSALPNIKYPNIKYFIYISDITNIDYDQQMSTLQLKTLELNTKINELYIKNNWGHTISNNNYIYIYMLLMM